MARIYRLQSIWLVLLHPMKYTNDVSSHELLELINAHSLIARTQGSSNVVVGILDGPVQLNNPLLATSIREVASGRGSCVKVEGAACAHGTFIAGVLAAKRESPAPAICPGCTFFVRPIFTDGDTSRIPSTSVGELTKAIYEAVDAGVHIINLSVGLGALSVGTDVNLQEAMNYAANRQVLIVAAAGNQASIGGTALTRHPWVIPVVACDRNRAPLAVSNLGRSVGLHGITAPGDGVTSLGVNGGLERLSGTSVAAPFITGVLALLRSEFPRATAVQLKAAILNNTERRRTCVVPPLLDVGEAYQRLQVTAGRIKPMVGKLVYPQAELGSGDLGAEQLESRMPEAVISSAVASLEAQSCSGCQAAADSRDGSTPVVWTPIYALGEVGQRWNNAGVENEYRLAKMQRRDVPPNQTEQQQLYDVLSNPAFRHLVRQSCWVFKVGGMETYVLQVRDPADLDLLVEAQSPPTNPSDRRYSLVIGLRGPLAPPQMCNGLTLPLVAVDQVYTFGKQEMISAVPLSAGVASEVKKASAAEKTALEVAFRNLASELFDRILQLADNAGATDDHRALNYLATRVADIYAKATEMSEKGFDLSAVDVKASRLSGTRRVLDVIFTYRNRSTDVTEKFFVRVDVTDEWPFALSFRLAPYYDR